MIRPLILVLLLIAAPASADVLTGTLVGESGGDGGITGVTTYLGPDRLRLEGYGGATFQAQAFYTVGGGITENGVFYRLRPITFTAAPGFPDSELPGSICDSYLYFLPPGPCGSIELHITGDRGVGTFFGTTNPVTGAPQTPTGVSYGPYSVTASGEIVFPDGHVRLIEGQGLATDVIHFDMGNGPLFNDELWIGTFTVPEPATGLLLLTGLGLMIAHRRLRHGPIFKV